jgi:hypothetical protein
MLWRFGGRGWSVRASELRGRKIKANDDVSCFHASLSGGVALRTLFGLVGILKCDCSFFSLHLLFIYLSHGFFSVGLYTMSRSTDSSATGDCPSLPWRALSATTIFGVAALCRSFLFMCSRPEINGLDHFLQLLESRQDTSRRTRGLLTGMILFLQNLSGSI